MNAGSVLGKIYLLVKLVPRTAALSVLGPAALLVFGYVAWTLWGASTLDRTLYSLQVDHLRLTPQPSWIQTDVRREVFDGSFLKDISVLDRQATSSVAQAFDMHPWVRQTHRVTKLDGGFVQVDVEYRKPMALVYLDSDSEVLKTSQSIQRSRSSELQAAKAVRSPPKNDENGTLEPYFFAIDEEGVLLPSKAPQTYRWQDFLMIYAKGASPTGTYGERFGDPRIHEAVRLCQLLAPLREKLEIESIYVYADRQMPTSQKFLFEVASRHQKRFEWGHAPGKEVQGEPPIESKISQLIQRFQNAP